MFSLKQIQWIAKTIKEVETQRLKYVHEGKLFDEPCILKDALVQAFISMFNESQLYLDGDRSLQLDFNAEAFVQWTRKEN